MDPSVLGYLSVLATVSTIGMFLTGIPICKGVMKLKSSEGTSIVPFAMCIVSCFYWLQYGILKRDLTVISINLIGFILEMIYFAIIYYFSISRRSVNLISIAVISSCAFLVYYLRLHGTHPTTLDHVGMACLILNVLNFASPLAVLRNVLETKTTKQLPKPIIVANLIVSTEWYLYGLMVSDPYIKTPNMIGIGLAMFQLSLFFIYPPERAHNK